MYLHPSLWSMPTTSKEANRSSAHVISYFPILIDTYGPFILCVGSKRPAPHMARLRELFTSPLGHFSMPPVESGYLCIGPETANFGGSRPHLGFHIPARPSLGRVLEAVIELAKHHFTHLVGREFLWLGQLYTLTVGIDAYPNIRSSCLYETIQRINLAYLRPTV